MNALAAFRVSGNPVTVGQAADIGSFAVDVLTGLTYFKYGAGNTEWVRAGYPLRPLKTQTTSGVSLGTNETTLHTFDLPAGLFGTGVADNDIVCRSSSIRFSPGNALGA